jgi:Fungal specific transcription factor domain
MGIDLEILAMIGIPGLQQNQRNGRIPLSVIYFISTAFCLWIMDCRLAMYIGDRPSIPLHEIRHTIQCHEDIWSARTAAEWTQRRKNMPVNDSEFPLIMLMLISPDIPDPPPNLSILGAFSLLHGTTSSYNK